jgi:hypothetical protein
MPEHLLGFEIATKHKEAIRQLLNFAEIPIPKLMDRYGLEYSTVQQILNYDILERAWPTQTGRLQMLNDLQIHWIIDYCSDS